MSLKIILKKISVLFVVIVFVFMPLYVTRIQSANAQLDSVIGGLASCGLGTVVTSITGSLYSTLENAVGGVVDSVVGGGGDVGGGSTSGTEVPTTDATTQGKIDETNSLTDFGNTLTDDGNSLYANKEYILDCLVRQAAQMLLESVVDSFLGWTNTGFDGSSFYVQNPASFYTGIENEIARRFLSEDVSLAMQGNPYSSSVISLMAEGQSRPTLKEKLACPGKNMDEVFQGGESDSWFAFMEAGTTPGCTPEGSYIVANKELQKAQTNAVALSKEELDRNEGWLSKRDEVGNITTPGNIINALVKKNLEIGLEQATQNDELAELFAGLLDKTQKGITEGLLEYTGTGSSQDTGQTIEGLPWQNETTETTETIET